MDANHSTTWPDLYESWNSLLPDVAPRFASFATFHIVRAQTDIERMKIHDFGDHCWHRATPDRLARAHPEPVGNPVLETAYKLLQAKDDAELVAAVLITASTFAKMKELDRVVSWRGEGFTALEAVNRASSAQLERHGLGSWAPGSRELLPFQLGLRELEPTSHPIAILRICMIEAAVIQAGWQLVTYEV